MKIISPVSKRCKETVLKMPQKLSGFLGAVSQRLKYFTNTGPKTWPGTCVKDRRQNIQAEYKTSFTSVESSLYAKASWA